MRNVANPRIADNPKLTKLTTTSAFASESATDPRFNLNISWKTTANDSGHSIEAIGSMEDIHIRHTANDDSLPVTTYQLSGPMRCHEA